MQRVQLLERAEVYRHRTARLFLASHKVQVPTHIEHNLPNIVSLVKLPQSVEVDIEDVAGVLQRAKVYSHHLLARLLLAFQMLGSGDESNYKTKTQVSR